MKKVFILVFAAFMILLNGATALSGISTRVEPHPFMVTCKEVKTGTLREIRYNTQLTTQARNQGLSGLTAAGYRGGLEEGDDKNAYNFVHNRVPTNTKVFPFRSVCYLQSYFDSDKDGDIDDNDISFIGSGFLTGPNAVATCGHMLYSEQYGWCHHVEVFPAKDADYEPYQANSTRIYVASSWVSNLDENYDWGLIEIDFNYGKYLGWFGRHWRNWSLKGENVNVTGYPNDKETYQWRAPGTIQNSHQYLLEYGCDIVVGVSGSPVYNKDNIVLGINTYKTSCIGGGVRITEELYCFLDNFD